MSMSEHVAENGSPLKRFLNRALFDLSTPLGRRVNLSIVVVILCSAVLSMISTIEQIPTPIRGGMRLAEWTVTLMFAAEYFTRLAVARRPFAYLFSFYGLIDLLTWLPLLLLGDANLALRLLRVLRLLKLVRYMRALRLFLSSMHDALDIVLVVIGAIIIIIMISGNMIHYLEPERFSNAFEGSWWSLVTMTTVGYGDMVPATLGGKVTAALLMLAGITMFALLTGTISVKVAKLLSENRHCQSCHVLISQEYYFCPHCGAEQTEDKGLQCRDCGRTVDADDHFCKGCGSKLSEQAGL